MYLKQGFRYPKRWQDGGCRLSPGPQHGFAPRGVAAGESMAPPPPPHLGRHPAPHVAPRPPSPQTAIRSAPARLVAPRASPASGPRGISVSGAASACSSCSCRSGDIRGQPSPRPPRAPGHAPRSWSRHTWAFAGLHPLSHRQSLFSGRCSHTSLRAGTLPAVQVPTHVCASAMRSCSVQNDRPLPEPRPVLCAALCIRLMQDPGQREGQRETENVVITAVTLTLADASVYIYFKKLPLVSIISIP